MPRFYAELCVWFEASSEEAAQRIAEAARWQVDAVEGVTSVSINSVEEDAAEDDNIAESHCELCGEFESECTCDDEVCATCKGNHYVGPDLTECPTCEGGRR